MQTKAERIAEIEVELAEITLAISHILKGGQSYMIMSASGAGTQRTVTMANYPDLVKEKNSLRGELKSLEGTKGTRIGIGY